MNGTKIAEHPSQIILCYFDRIIYTHNFNTKLLRPNIRNILILLSNLRVEVAFPYQIE